MKVGNKNSINTRKMIAAKIPCRHIFELKNVLKQSNQEATRTCFTLILRQRTYHCWSFVNMSLDWRNTSDHYSLGRDLTGLLSAVGPKSSKSFKAALRSSWPPPSNTLKIVSPPQLSINSGDTTVINDPTPQGRRRGKQGLKPKQFRRKKNTHGKA